VKCQKDILLICEHTDSMPRFAVSYYSVVFVFYYFVFCFFFKSFYNIHYLQRKAVDGLNEFFGRTTRVRFFDRFAEPVKTGSRLDGLVVWH